MENTPDSLMYKLILTVPFVIGVAGNIAALCILYYTAKRRNAKHVLLLRFLAANDLVSEMGMLTIIYLPVSYSKCVVVVLLRAFGLGSGCVAFVMAVERWLALTKPFFYQQHVTYWVLVRAVAAIWLIEVLITYLPLYTNYGLFYENGQCKKYREAEKKEDIIYAYLFFTFGVTICVVIAYCNTMVFWELSKLGSRRKQLVRRTSRSTMNNSRIENCREYATSEERAFATVMAFLGIMFVVCWLPQMILIPIAQLEYKGKMYGILSKIANALLAIYFTVDPYVYVFKHYIDRRKFRLPFKSKRSSSSTAHGSTAGGTPTTVLLSAPSFTATNV
ncbi:7 transmembrane receptor (rhodopsin family) [Popillia japonica]|uniref:7 transmembrane receptor (Rhodopsin family) n=1 Tax=Popillia japonica TaxID=7064 RepID=A0AAW1NI45_POPJA